MLGGGALYSEGESLFTSPQICFSSSALSRSMYTRALYRSNGNCINLASRSSLEST